MRGKGFKSQPGQKCLSIFLLHSHLIANSTRMNTLTVHYWWDDEMARERTGHSPSYAKVKKMKLLTLHTHGSLRASLWDCSSSYSKCNYSYCIIIITALLNTEVTKHVILFKYRISTFTSSFLSGKTSNSGKVKDLTHFDCTCTGTFT